MALELFESKVESALRFSRWLWAINPEARDMLDKSFGDWAKLLLGADAVARAELGWLLTGSARCALEAASQQAVQSEQALEDEPQQTKRMAFG